MSKKIPRKVKSKKDIVSEIQLIQDSDRRRSLIRDIVFPYLVSMDDTIGYTKVFLQAFGGIITGALEEMEKKVTVGDLVPQLTRKLEETFKVKDPDQKREFERYMGLVKLLTEVSVQDLAYATELGRYIDGYLLQEKQKESIKKIPIDTILG